MQKKDLVVCRNFPYILGGAERSLFSELLKYNTSVDLINLKQSGSKFDLNELTVSSVVSIQDYKHSKLKNLEYYLNKNKIFSTIKPQDYSKVITQGLWAPCAIKFANENNIRSTYYIRDETSLNIFPNYQQGYKKQLKNFASLLEGPFRKIYSIDNEKAIKGATTVISNSNYIAEQVYKKFGIKSDVVYPYIDKNSLIKQFELKSKTVGFKEKGIILIGDTAIKGLSVFLELAKKFPNEKFYIFGKNKEFQSELSNVEHLGWHSDSSVPYMYAKLVLVPSLWNEAYGRVAAEASVLGIPVIVSNIGGLPEAVGHDSTLIADSTEDFSKKIKLVL